MKKIISLAILIPLLFYSLYKFEVDFELTNIWFLLIILSVLSIFFIIVIYAIEKKTNKIKFLESKLEVWNSLSYNVKKAGDEAFNELPIGIILYDKDYEIRWANKYSNDIFKEKINDKKLVDVDPKLLDIINNVYEETYSINNKKYEIINKRDSNLLYFFDVTKREEIKTNYINRTLAVIFISFDYFEESLSALDLGVKSAVRGQYLALVSDFASKYKAYLTTNEDLSILITTKENLKKMIEDKFDILDKIKEVSKMNNLRITASIGAASWDLSFEEVGTYAKNALDLAEKRGGDQAVVNIENEQVKYFGGKTNAIEKTTKIESRLKTSILKELIEESSNVIIMGHINMDADSFASALGVLKMCIYSDIEAYIYIDDDKIDYTVNKLLNEINVQKETKKHIKNEEFILNIINNKSLLVILDTQTPKIVMSQEILNKVKRKAVIDHHRTDDQAFTDLDFSYIEPYASSTIELVVEMLNFYIPKYELTSIESTIMMLGIIVDTNDFTFRSGVRTFEVAGILRANNADMIKARMLLRESFDKQVLIHKLANKVIVLQKRFAIVKADSGRYDRVLLSKVSNIILDIENIDAAFTIGYIDEYKVGISARSYGDLNVQLIMEELGGGGHLNNAACQISNKTIEEVYDLLKEILEREFYEGDNFMKVILLEDLKGKGKKNDIIDVAIGYGNFLLSNKKAILANDENIKKLEEEKEKELLAIQATIQTMKKLKEEIDGKNINIGIRVGSDGKLFGSVTSKMIIEEFENQTGITLDKRKLNLDTEINSLGIYKVKVNLYKDINAEFLVHVIEK